MDDMWSEAIGGINGYIAGLEPNMEVMLASFDSVGYDVVRNTSVKNFEKIGQTEITPRGGTPLLDAAGRMMWNMIDSKADRAILVIVTDGEENSSRKFKADEIRQMTKKITDTLNYEMVFLGANFDKIEDVASVNFGWNDKSRTISASENSFGATMQTTLNSTRLYMSTGNKADMFYSAADKANAKK